ncbi:MAG: division/cell wall cluster transcriptional repressor MraZ [Phycisphaerales bacterium JB063]
MVFTGSYEHAIDAKNRIAIPSGIRRKLQRELERGDGQGDGPIVLYAVLAGEETIALYTEAGYERLSEELRNSGLDPEELLEYEDLFHGMSQDIELDKAGRAKLPDHLLERTGLSGEVALTGAGDHLKIRDKVAWQAKLDAKLADNPGVLVNPRMLIGRRKDRAGA